MPDFVKLLSKYDYAELRIERTNEINISFKDDEIKPSVGPSYGLSARVLKNGSWGFASSEKADVSKLLETAERMASLTKGDVKLKELPIEKKKLHRKTDEISLEEKINALKQAKKHAEGKRIKNRNLNYMEWHTQKEFYNSHGSEIIEEQLHVYFSCQCIGQNNGIIQRGHERASSTKGFNEIQYAKVCEDAANKTERLLDAAAPPKGRFNVIMDNEMTGVFSHEAVGHACEGDSIIERESILRGKLGKKIGSELVTIIDDPTAQGFGNYGYDDEGVKAKPAMLIKQGVLKGFMTSRETAHELKHEANGHARAMDFANYPIIRMSNTHFLAGKAKIDELFDVPNAIYVKGMKGGSVDIFAGGYMFKAEEAWEIRNGNREKSFRDVTLIGNILETLNGVDLVANDFSTNPGFCGKMGQEAPVSDGGPHIRVKNIALG